jgi:hypothetical protein
MMQQRRAAARGEQHGPAVSTQPPPHPPGLSRVVARPTCCCCALLAPALPSPLLALTLRTLLAPLPFPLPCWPHARAPALPSPLLLHLGLTLSHSGFLDFSISHFALFFLTLQLYSYFDYPFSSSLSSLCHLFTRPLLHHCHSE